jgi:hypothetical protein
MSAPLLLAGILVGVVAFALIGASSSWWLGAVIGGGLIALCAVIQAAMLLYRDTEPWWTGRSSY